MAHPNAVRAKLGHAASIGGPSYVERAAFSDEMMGKFVEMDAAARKKALAIVNRAIEKARTAPVKKPPSRNERVKIRWTDELNARFRATAPWVKSDKVLAVKLGFPDYCAGAMSAARSRLLPRAAATRKPAPRPQIESLAADLKRAA